MKTYDQFLADHPAGSRIGDDTLVRTGEETETTKYQCVSYVKAYIRETRDIEPGFWGNAITYWSGTVRALLDICDKITDGHPKAGDIAVFKTKGHNDYTHPGHIGIATGVYNASQMLIWEQNGQTGGGTGTGPDAIRQRWIDRSRLAGLLRLRAIQEPAPYWVQDIPTKTIRLRYDATLWDMTQRTFEAMQSHPVGRYPENYEQTTAAICHHKNGYSYYLVGNMDTTGFNTLDCADYTPAPPAPPLPYKLAEKYTVVTRLMRFPSALDAQRRINYSDADIEPGTYIAIEKVGEAYNLTDDNMKDKNWWVNTLDNTAPAVLPVPPKIAETIQNAATHIPSPPSPNTWKVTKSLSPDGRPVEYISTNTEVVYLHDLTGKFDIPIPLPPRTRLRLVSRFWKEDETGELIEYGRDERFAKGHWFYSLRMDMCKPIAASPIPLDINRDGRVNNRDFLDFIDYAGRRSYATFTASRDKFIAAVPKARKFIDGIVKKERAE